MYRFGRVRTHALMGQHNLYTYSITPAPWEEKYILQSSNGQLQRLQRKLFLRSNLLVRLAVLCGMALEGWHLLR